MDLKYTQSRPKDVGWIFRAMTVAAFNECDTDIPGFTKVTKLLIWLTNISYLVHICTMELAYCLFCFPGVTIHCGCIFTAR